MPGTPRVRKSLERRPGSSYQQLCIKGKRIWGWTLYCEFMNMNRSSGLELRRQHDRPWIG